MNTHTHEHKKSFACVWLFNWNEIALKLENFPATPTPIYLFKMICWVELSLRCNQIKFPGFLMCSDCYILYLSFVVVVFLSVFCFYRLNNSHFECDYYAMKCERAKKNTLSAKSLQKSHFVYNSWVMINIVQYNAQLLVR